MTSLWHHDMQGLQWSVVVAASLAAAVTDVRSRRIPNKLTGPMLLTGLCWAAYQAGLAGVADSAIACILLAGPYVLLFLLAGGGAGDAKLMGAIGSWLGICNGLIALAAVSVAAIVLAVGYSLVRKRGRSLLANLAHIVFHGLFFVLSAGKVREISSELADTGKMQKMPYGPAIFAGVCIAAGGTLLWRM